MQERTRAFALYRRHQSDMLATMTSRRRQFCHILLLAALLTVLNALKPIHIDDAGFHLYAKQIAAHPLDPYGFSLLYVDRSTPANELLAPPVFLYWWGLGIAVWGHHPVLWKLWLFPVCLILVSSIVALSKVFAPGLEKPLAWMACLSPAVLPNINLMLDVPSLAFNLLAVVVFVRALERNSQRLALLSGVIVALSIETKYTGFLAVGAIILYSLVARKPGFGFLSCLVGMSLFGLWEAFTHYRYGVSHFLFRLQHNNEFSSMGKTALILPTINFLGGLAPVLIPMGLIALYRSRRLLLLGSGVVTAVFAYVVLVPERYLQGFSGDPRSVVDPVTQNHRFFQDRVTQNDYLFTALGLVVLVIAAAVLLRLWKREHEGEGRKVFWFLVAWLALEVVGVFALSPFMAARRVMELIVVLTLIFGRLASTTCTGPNWRPWLNRLAGFSVVLGLGYFVVDLCEAEAFKGVVQEAARSIRKRQPDANIWYAGYIGIEFYAEEAGMKPVIPFHPKPSSRSGATSPQREDGPAPLKPSTLRKGDWLIAPDPRIFQQRLRELFPLDHDLLEVFEPIVAQDSLHVRTYGSYYGGVVPLRHDEAPRVVMGILRAKQDFSPRTP